MDWIGRPIHFRTSARTRQEVGAHNQTNDFQQVRSSGQKSFQIALENVCKKLKLVW